METKKQNSNRKNASIFEKLMPALQNVLTTYFKEKPHVSINALSKKCKISEPTLRRLTKGQVKTLPTTSTILDILTIVSGETNTTKIAKLYPGPIAEYLDYILPKLQNSSVEYNSDLNTELSNPTKYLIFKLSANSCGLRSNQMRDLFGAVGEKFAVELMQKGFLRKEGSTYYSNLKHFSTNQDAFISNFKLVADFIKVNLDNSQSSSLALKANFSESLSLQAYKEILLIQKKALRKITAIMSAETSKGDIPVFLLSAIDTFESKTISDSN